MAEGLSSDPGIQGTMTKKRSTHAERIFAECCKRLRIPYRFKEKVGGREVDFLIGKYAIEIDGHSQDPEKNRTLIANGYSPIHFQNRHVSEGRNKIIEFLKPLCQSHITGTRARPSPPPRRR